MASVDTTDESWTFGVEHELSDWDAWAMLPNGFSRSPDYTIVNSNGIAAQPNIRDYRYGGEINTPPTDMVEGQVLCLAQIIRTFPTCTVNHRSNLHIHIQVPGLKESLKHLLQVQRYIHEQLPLIINLIEPIPHGKTLPERKRERRRKVSHHTLLSKPRLEKQLRAKSVERFFELEVPKTKEGKPMWHAQPRLAVSLRQLLQTDTVEFRHFPGTLSLLELETCLNWCRDFMLAAFSGRCLLSMYNKSYHLTHKFPTFPDFDLDLEVGYQATASHNGVPHREVLENIQLIEQGKFHGSKAEQEAKARAGCVPRKPMP
jgi:hypothetical protein